MPAALKCEVAEAPPSWWKIAEAGPPSITVSALSRDTYSREGFEGFAFPFVEGFDFGVAFDARNQYIDWQEFYLWVRSILEAENGIPDWLVEILDTRCPGFLENEKRLTPRASRSRPLPLRLEDWIDDHIFDFAKQEGWFNAITFYAVREPRYQRAEVCRSECVERWKKAKPLRYPSFEEWKDMAAGCDNTGTSGARDTRRHGAHQTGCPRSAS